MMGGDFAPLEAVKGILLYLSAHNTTTDLLLIGDKPQIEKLLTEYKVPTGHIKITHAEEVIDPPEHIPPDLSVPGIRYGDIVADQQKLPIRA